MKTDIIIYRVVGEHGPICFAYEHLAQKYAAEQNSEVEVVHTIWGDDEKKLT